MRIVSIICIYIINAEKYFIDILVFYFIPRVIHLISCPSSPYHLFHLIMLLAQFQHLFALRNQNQTSLQALRSHARFGIKSRLCQPVALKVQATVLWIIGGHACFTALVTDANIAVFKTALHFGYDISCLSYCLNSKTS